MLFQKEYLIDGVYENNSWSGVRIVECTTRHLTQSVHVGRHIIILLQKDQDKVEMHSHGNCTEHIL